MSTDPALARTAMIDADHPEVIAFAHAAIGDAADDKTRAIRIYYAVRDKIRYDPYRVDLSEAGLSASRALANGYGSCVPKAALMAAACRAVGVGARVGYADVYNHLSTQRLREAIGTDIYYYHGYTSVRIGDRWIKATPTFNVELCAKLNLATLEFDGENDSIFHPFSPDGARHMEYLQFHGEFYDVQRSSILAAYAEHYPNFEVLGTADWDRDIEREGAG